jgi:hypothetical protein
VTVPYMSPEKAAEIAALEAIVRAKVAAGFQYGDPPALWRSKFARLEWMVAKAMCNQMAETNSSSGPSRQFDALRDHSFDSLWAHCKSNNRLFPKDWGTLYHLLANKEQDAAGRWEPPLPLNLSDWFCIHGEEAKQHMQLRFKEHVEWARGNGQLTEVDAYVRSLVEDEWIHFGEL